MACSNQPRRQWPPAMLDLDRFSRGLLPEPTAHGQPPDRAAAAAAAATLPWPLDWCAPCLLLGAPKS